MMRLILVAAFALALTACSQTRTTASGGGAPSFVKVYRKTDGSTMYFAGPMHYAGKNGNLMVDFTVNQSGENNDYVVCNFTFTSSQNSSFKPTGLQMKDGSVESDPVTEFELFFAEKKKKTYMYRYSCVVQKSVWIAWMGADNHALVINGMEFDGGKKHKRRVGEVRDYILFPLSQN